MANIVLLHGAWHGSWCWSRVRSILESHGHNVLTPTFTGLGERAHLLSQHVGLRTHVDDITSVLRYESLQDCVLVGHSYAGLIIPGVLNWAVSASTTPAIVHVVYLDAVLAEQGQRWADTHTERDRDARLASAVLNSDGTSVFPVPSVANMGVTTRKDIAWANNLLTPHPAKTYTDLQPDVLDATRFPTTYINCTEPRLPALEASKVRARTIGCDLIDIHAGHDCMISHPDLTAASILSCLSNTL